MMKQALMTAVFLGLAASPVLAHGGGPHLKGTVSAISADQITVKDARAVALGAVAVFSAASHAQADARPEAAARDVVIRFERAVQDHDVPGIAALVADDIVVFENGHRNDGWQDFRDNHLVPEMKEPKLLAKSTPVKLRATPQMAWGYTRTELFADPAKPKTVTHILWSVYILEPRQEGWRIVSLDWSIAKQK